MTAKDRKHTSDTASIGAKISPITYDMLINRTLRDKQLRAFLVFLLVPRFRSHCIPANKEKGLSLWLRRHEM
jgi:hypothetical protein